MAMLFEAVMVTPEQARELLGDPDLVRELVEAGGGSDRFLDLDQAWHGIHWLLTGSVREVGGTLGLAILGGTPVGEDSGNGPARLLSPDEVRRVAAALADVSVEDLRTRYNPRAMDAAGVSPTASGDDYFDDYLGPNVQDLKDFYARAASGGQAVVVSIV